MVSKTKLSSVNSLKGVSSNSEPSLGRDDRATGDHGSSSSSCQQQHNSENWDMDVQTLYGQTGQRQKRNEKNECQYIRIL
ncbi:hypothetical protein PoB_002398700 [Plakobranchus ocellatus]|uniref:Uncharacterized protein n=1 Tax=Plakobranchus ocellatus TaxID=259542 RepID=A0AAV3ZS38_9GAST|nr:hypothetical protein PoB_002398700 [Plakobranchus ocellatus]